MLHLEVNTKSLQFDHSREHTSSCHRFDVYGDLINIIQRCFSQGGSRNLACQGYECRVGSSVKVALDAIVRDSSKCHDGKYN